MPAESACVSLLVLILDRVYRAAFLVGIGPCGTLPRETPRVGVIVAVTPPCALASGEEFAWLVAGELGHVQYPRRRVVHAPPVFGIRVGGWSIRRPAYCSLLLRGGIVL